MSIKNTLRHGLLVAATMLGPDTGFAQRVVSANAVMSSEQKDLLSNLQKLSKEIADGKQDDALMSKLLDRKIQEFEKETKRAHSRKPAYFFATVAGPKELGQPHAIVIDPDNKTVTVFTNVSVGEDGKLIVGKDDASVVFAKDKKMRDPETKARVIDAALHTLNESQGEFTTREATRKASSPTTQKQ
jgi:hypothetical protein